MESDSSSSFDQSNRCCYDVAMGYEHFPIVPPFYGGNYGKELLQQQGIWDASAQIGDVDVEQSFFPMLHEPAGFIFDTRFAPFTSTHQVFPDSKLYGCDGSVNQRKENFAKHGESKFGKASSEMDRIENCFVEQSCKEGYNEHIKGAVDLTSSSDCSGSEFLF